jgi:hypothetical protein
MNAPKRRRIPAAALFSLALAAIALGLPSVVRADQSAGCREGHDCSTYDQPGKCGAGNGACYCYQTVGDLAERQPACNVDIEG